MNNKQKNLLLVELLLTIRRCPLRIAYCLLLIEHSPS